VFYGEIGGIFTPRNFCCTDPNDLGIVDGKAPVAVINLDPNPAYIGETVSYDGTDSYDPDGSITAWSWGFEGHTPSTGTASTGTLNYGTIPGTFNIALTVTDGTSVKSSPARVQLVVSDGEFAGYAAAAGSGGVFYTDDAGQTWTAKNGAIQSGDLATFSVVVDPMTQHLPVANKTLWRANEPGLTGGVLVSPDGGDTWYSKGAPTTGNPWGDSPSSSGTACYLYFVRDRVFLVERWQNSSGYWRTALFYSDDAADIRADPSTSLTWTQVTTPGMIA
jgi:hypothetical protein